MPKGTTMNKRITIIAVFAMIFVIFIAMAIVAHQEPDTAVQATQPTPIPTAVATKPPSQTPMPTLQQRLGGMLNGDTNVETYTFNTDTGPTTTKALYDAKSQTVNVTADVAYHNETDSIKWVTYYIFKDIYTSGISAIKSVDLRVFGLVQDQYGKKSSIVIATATLNADTAKQIVWENLDNNGAWSVYDATWLLPLS
jgi:hypothetical protein